MTQNVQIRIIIFFLYENESKVLRGLVVQEDLAQLFQTMFNFMAQIPPNFC